MAKFTRSDTTLLQEAYDLRLLKENAPAMTLDQVIKNLDIMSESELVYMNTVADRILNEFGGGLRALGGAVGSGLKKLGGAAVQGAKDRVGSAVQGAKGIAQGAAAAGRQAATNIGDIYQTGQQVSSSSKSLEQAQSAMQQLIDLVTDAQRQGLIKVGGDITKMTLEKIINTLSNAQQGAQTSQQDAQQRGIGGGIKDAFTRGRQA